MAGRAFASIRPLRELRPVRTGRMAIRALFKCQRFLEVSTLMALRARNFHVFSQERILRLGMVKSLAYCRNGNLLPSTCVVARLASLGEAALVRVGVAIRALGKGQADEPRFVVGAGCVALLASDLRVQSRQRVASFPVVKLAYILPVSRVVALLAVRPKPSVVLILVAPDAIRPNAQESLVQVLHLDQRSHCRRNVLGTVAAIACEA